MSEIQIESGIPIPKRSNSGRRPGSFAYLIEALIRNGEQEDSILLPYREDPIKTLRCVRSAAYGVGKEYGFKTPIRREDGGIRVWKGKPRTKVVEQDRTAEQEEYHELPE